jgi:predicted ester cyclase
MSLEKNKAVFRSFFETLNKKDLSLLDKFVHPDYIEHTMKLKGLEGVKQMMTKFYKGFPDLHVTIKRIIAEDDMFWIKVKLTGTHLGEYNGLALTGKKVAFLGVDIARLENGKIIEAESVNNFLDFYKDLDVIEYTEKGKTISSE